MGKVRIAATADAPGKGTKNMRARIDRAARIKNKHLFAEEQDPTKPPKRKSDVLKLPPKPERPAAVTTKRRLSKAEKRRLKKAGHVVGGAGQGAATVAAATSTAANPLEPTWRKHLTKFYEKHNPAKLQADPLFIHKILQRIGGKEDAFKKLFATLNHRYPSSGGNQEGGNGSGMGKHAARKTPKEIRAGDWKCPKCGVHNFASRMQCVTCKDARGDTPDLAPDSTSASAGEQKQVESLKSGSADTSAAKTDGVPLRKRVRESAKELSAGPIPGVDRALAAEAEDAVGQLSVLDVKLGIGAAAGKGQLLILQYRGTLDDGSEFGSGRLTCTLGSGDIVRGLAMGLEGMREGGTRAIRIPPALGYGEEGRPEGGIPANSWLLFMVNLLRVGKHRERGQRGGSDMLPLPSEFLGKNREKLMGNGSGGGQQQKQKGPLGRRAKKRLAKKKQAQAANSLGARANKAVGMKSARVRGEEDED